MRGRYSWSRRRNPWRRPPWRQKPPRPPPKLNPVRVKVREETVEVRTLDCREVLHAYSKEDACSRRAGASSCRRPWCVEACPITQDCREYIRCRDRDFEMRRPGVMAAARQPARHRLCKVCYHYCEDACVVKKKGVPIAIRHLKRASAQFGMMDFVYVPRSPGTARRRRRRGPAGMMAAWELGIRGYRLRSSSRSRASGPDANDPRLPDDRRGRGDGPRAVQGPRRHVRARPQDRGRHLPDAAAGRGVPGGLPLDRNPHPPDAGRHGGGAARESCRCYRSSRTSTSGRR